MAEKGKTLSEMLKGIGTLEESADFDVSWFRVVHICSAIVVLIAYRFLVAPWKGRKKIAFNTEMKSLKNLPLRLPDPILGSESETKYFLNENELEFFKQNGYLPPFSVVSEQEAAELKDLALDEYDKDFHGISFLGDKVHDIELKHGNWPIEDAGTYQALRLPQFRELLRKPQIAHRLASLLGEEVICWRTQFFHKLPDTEPTVWHQNATFRESGKFAKLQPTLDTDPAMIQLNAWVALSDSTRENGCLRLLPGSCADARISFLYEYIQNNRYFYLSQLPLSLSYLYAIAKIGFYGSIFAKSALVFFTAVEILGEDFFENFEVLDVEMKAGECLIFSALNMHASYPNITKSDCRFSFLGRCTTTHVKVSPSGKDRFPSAEGLVEFELPEVSSFQIYGGDSYGYNKILRN
ncbi:phytanoyl-CoA dioxygenase family protein [Microbulbifer sp. VAAF005]|uniref:phytanoyl-CoA dioxygenase family protein n=1 Tax=Microbulbifer sp. VAAF005 TaxID=3034230 RepID=UPI0024AE83FB|nr:phytanoyl-CoA dioxygenase family protein [Microbulbifer sp. VAAF005]WHI47591.1 phytanoyl-CoA dioxygenase family protein [Microbulbifer sp. VAAF005]